MSVHFKPAAIFSSGAVLQRRIPVCVFGQGPEGERVTVILAEHLAGAQVQNGRWAVLLPAMEAAMDLTLTIVCGEEVYTAHDIAIGEVWIAGGQSNMEFWLRNEAERETVIPTAKDTLLRFYDMPRISYDGQEMDISFDEYGKWRTFTPKDAGWFSAVGAYFGLALRKALGVPVAVIGCNHGATSASCWMREDYLDAVPQLEYYRRTYEETVKNLDMEKYTADFKEKQTWGLTPHMQEIDRRLARGEIPPTEVVQLLKGMTPRQLELFSLPVGPLTPTRPFALYHNMVEKLAPYTAKGVIWYQGEADQVLPDAYACLFGQMVRCWRDAWQSELPFLTVQLAPFGHWLSDTGTAFPVLRAQQRLAADTIPGVWMTNIMDCGMEEDIHPKHKRPVGERLALLAQNKVYGNTDLLCEAPRPCGYIKTEKKLVIRFSHTGTGLTCSAKLPAGFKVIADGNETVVQVRIYGDTICLCAEEFLNAQKIDVLYAQLPYVKVDLYNSAHIPAEPFRLQWEASDEKGEQEVS